MQVCVVCGYAKVNWRLLPDQFLKEAHYVKLKLLGERNNKNTNSSQ
jgi:hypothetical protein